MLAQGGAQNHAFDVVHGGRHAPGRVAKARVRRRAALGAELAHHASQAFGPVAGPESAARAGDALNENLAVG